MSTDYLIILIPLLPLIAAVITAILGPRLLGRNCHWPTVLAIGASFLLSLFLLSDVNKQAAQATDQVGWEQTVDLWTWVDVPGADAQAEGDSPRNFDIRITLRVDALTSMMLSMVTFVSFFVAIYASGYMHGDRSYWRFFTYVSLFVFSMTMLVSASNFMLLFVFWEAVGVCSYLLVGFWYEKPPAAAAGKKAFLVNRVGDFGFLLAIALIWCTYGTLNFHDTEHVLGVLGQTRLADPSLFITGEVLWGGVTVGTAICLLLMVGACGKSAQFPLHVWLPDAMEGPTPVSALIHAATMVTAGVYMVTRCTPLFMIAPDAQTVVAVIGGFTALMAGIIAMTQNDLKRVLAYSTISQLGYMFLALGTGSLLGICAGMFHLFTHAMFKALLFLGAGSVMHAMGGVLDMRRFGGLRKLMPVTHYTFLCGCLALAGVFPLAGFWSKDSILGAVHERAHHDGGGVFMVLDYVGMFAAFLTAFYTFRAFFMTFYGREEIPEEAGDHAHESPSSMTVPLRVLAVGAVFAGLLFGSVTETPLLERLSFYNLIGQAPSLAYESVTATGDSHEFHMDVAVKSSVVAILGIALAAFFYLGDRREVTRIAKMWLVRPLYLLSYGKFFWDPIYLVLVVWPALGVGHVAAWIDRSLIDGLVNLIGSLPGQLSRMVRSMQNGLVQYYAMLMVLGLLVLIGTWYWQAIY